MGRGGPARWTYRVLTEPHLSAELRRHAHPYSASGVDGITFQPSPIHEFRNQDRSRVEHWPMHGGTWVFAAIFDGHVGHHTVDHAAQAMPAMVKHALDSYLRSSSRAAYAPERISSILSDAIVRFDNSITEAFINLFPGGPSTLQRMTDGQIRQIVDDRASGGRNYMTAVRCLQGTTALLTLTDPSKSNLWIANLGDSQAVLAGRNPSGQWGVNFATTLHDGDNHYELHRLRHEHPGERDCARDNRVIGFLGPTRSVGDTWLKVPALYSQRVLLSMRHEWNVDRPEHYISRIRSPPYVSNEPDVQHLPLPRGSRGRDLALIMCSDGLPDLYSRLSRRDATSHWARVVGRALDARSPAPNLALLLLRDALGGDDVRLVSQYLTVEMDEKWTDDVTIIVQRF
ncbi:protein serine/threonine phosphatase 2C [Dentipellis sp. KUC8613]|nr:protein serine/threonine phosphatase 2C [Dentipellis sp. KUC8613]